MKSSRGVIWKLGLPFLAAQLFRQSPLVALNGELPAGARLRFPVLYDLLAPFTAGADRAALLSSDQLKSLAAWLALGLLLAALSGLRGRRGWEALQAALGRGALALAALLAFFAWALFWERPMARLELAGLPDTLAVNFHSHSRFSWDGRKGATPAANMAWHRAGGWDAAFITDHNSIEGSVQGKRFARDEEDKAWGRYSLSGAELGLAGLHLVNAGCAQDVRRDHAAGDPGIAPAIQELHACGGAALASLPEYRRYHWEQLAELADWGVDGFEVFNATPEGLLLTPADREAVLALCRQRGLAVVGVSDNHGWGSTAPAWNLMQVPGWRGLAPEELQKALVAKLRKGGSSASLVVARRRLEPESLAALALDPPLELWSLLRGLSPLQAAVSLLWLAGLSALLRRRSGRLAI